MKKKRDNKLIRKFNEEVGRSDAVSLASGLVIAPNFEEIEEIINAQDCDTKMLREFYQYLKSLNGDDQSVVKLDIYKGNKTIWISGKLNAAYKALLKKVESRLNSTETAFSVTTQGSSSAWIKNAVTLTGNLGGFLTAAATSFAMLTRQVVEGMTIFSHAKTEKMDLTPTINRLLDSDKSNWFNYYVSIETMLQEFDNHSNVITKDKKRLFFEFLEKVLSANKVSNLSDEAKAKFFRIAEKELENTFYDLNKVSDVEQIYRLFLIFLKLDYKKNKNSVEKIFNFLYRFEKMLTTHKIVFNEENKQDIEHKIGNIFWVLLSNNEKYAKSFVNFFDVDRFKQHIDVLQVMSLEVYKWDSNSIVSFRIFLQVMSKLRFFRFADDKNMILYLNGIVENYIAEGLRLAKNKCLYLTEDEIKEAADIAYVNQLPSEEKVAFSGLYKDVKKSDVFPHGYQVDIPTSSGMLQLVIYSEKELSAEEKSLVENEINTAYKNMKDEKLKLGVSDKEDNNKIIRVFLFKKHDSYLKYGPLWRINTAGGGYAHVRSSSAKELSVQGGERFESKNPTVEIFVYFDGVKFLNLGHEVVHALCYVWLGLVNLNKLPDLLIEGIADHLGNENRFKELVDYLKSEQRQDHLLSVKQMIDLSYADGAVLYHSGDVLSRFIIEKHPGFLREIVLAIQKGKEKSEIDKMIREKVTNPEFEKEFRNWLIQLIEKSSKIIEGKEVTTNVQIEYRKDLKNNSHLLDLIQRYGSIEFTFGDIIFTLKTDELTVTNYYGGHRQNQREVTLGDYRWLKRALLINAGKNYLIENGSTENHNERLANYFSESIAYIENRDIKKISVPNDAKFKEIFEHFALKIYSESLSTKEFHEDLLNTPAKGTLLPTCQAYLNEKKQPILDKVQKEYLDDLEKNPGLSHFIEKYGAIEFIFSDTAFKLTTSGILRHYNETPQPVTQGDYNWFKRALAGYTIEKILLSMSEEEIENKKILEITPQMDPSFKQGLKKFALETYLQKNNQEFKNDLSEWTSDSKGISTTTSFPPFSIEVNHSARTMSLQSTLIDTMNGTEVTTLQTSESGQLPIFITLLSMSLLGLAVAAAGFYFYYNKNRKSVVSSDSESLQVTYDLSDAIVGTPPERISLTTVASNDNGDCDTTQPLINKNDKFFSESKNSPTFFPFKIIEVDKPSKIVVPIFTS